MADQPVVLVTGASSGIGQATAALFAQNGYQVFGTSRSAHNAEASSFQMLSLDVIQPDSVSACVTQVIQQAGRIDVLVNNAGLAQLSMIEETESADYLPVYETNLFGMLRVTQAVLPHMRVQKQGHIIGVGSLGSRIALPGTGHYAATKAAMVSLYGAMRYEIAPFNVKVSIVEPGRFASRMSAQALRPEGLEVYNKQRQKLFQLDAEMEVKAPSPDAVAAKILRIARTKNPRLRYLVGQDAFMINLLHKALPYSIFERIVRRMVA